MKKWTLIAFLGVFCLALNAQNQEFNTTVTINTPKLQTADPQVFEQLEVAILEFMNNTQWTNETFEDEERINVEILINISEERSAVQFKGDLQILATRPIYGSTDQTPVLNHQDKDFLFEYEQFQPLEYTQNQYQNNLTAVLSFYAYIILGMDFDTFSPFGGEPYFQVAQELVNLIPPNVASVYSGWRSVDSNQNRYWIVENMLSSRLRPYRQAMYDYHRQGLDLAHKDMPTARAIMKDALQNIETAIKNYPRAMVVQMFANAKRDEIVQIFLGGTREEKNDIKGMMRLVDPSKVSVYNAIN